MSPCWVLKPGAGFVNCILRSGFVDQIGEVSFVNCHAIESSADLIRPILSLVEQYIHTQGMVAGALNFGFSWVGTDGRGGNCHQALSLKRHRALRSRRCSRSATRSTVRLVSPGGLNRTGHVTRVSGSVFGPLTRFRPSHVQRGIHYHIPGIGRRLQLPLWGGGKTS